MELNENEKLKELMGHVSEKLYHDLMKALLRASQELDLKDIPMAGRLGYDPKTNSIVRVSGGS